MTTVVFLAATMAVPVLFGLPLVGVPSLRDNSMAARAAIAWAGGTVILTVLLTGFAAWGIPWLPWTVAATAVIPTAVALQMFEPRRPPNVTVERPDRPTLLAGVSGAVIAAAGLISFAAGGATSADLAYVWGAKAVQFASDRGMDFERMLQPHLIHLHPNYPPLWPVTLAWGATASGSMPWTAVPVLTWVYLAATGLIVHALLRRPLGGRAAALVVLLWFAVLTGSTIRSFSGGSAEGPLLLFVTVAVTALVVENRDEAPTLRWLAAGALAGAVLTKSEGAVTAILAIAGTGIRDWIWRRADVVRSTLRLAAPALMAAGLWAAVRAVHGVPLTDPIRETAMDVHFDDLEVILKVCARLLVNGTLWVGWLAPLAAVASVRPLQPLRALPGLLVVLGIPVFAAAYYLHAAGNPLELIVWTFPRLIQPSVSAWIVCAGLLCFAKPAAEPGSAD